MKFTYFLGYLFLVNLTGFLAILSDYIRSLFNFRRLPEKRYVFVAFAGGCFDWNFRQLRQLYILYDTPGQYPKTTFPRNGDCIR